MCNKHQILLYTGTMSHHSWQHGAQEKMRELVDRSLMGEKITISTGAGNIVMISEEDWDSLVEAVSVLTVPAVLESYKSSLKSATESA